MSITDFINSKATQIAVYWGNPQNDGRGKYTFDSPQEVLVRWEDMTENFAKDNESRVRIDKDGKEYRSNAHILTAHIPTGGWNLDGYLYLGRLTDLPSSLSPYDTDDAFEIKEIKALPELNNPSDKFYTIYL